MPNLTIGAQDCTTLEQIDGGARPSRDSTAIPRGAASIEATPR